MSASISVSLGLIRSGRPVMSAASVGPLESMTTRAACSRTILASRSRNAGGVSPGALPEITTTSASCAISGSPWRSSSHAVSATSGPDSRISVAMSDSSSSTVWQVRDSLSCSQTKRGITPAPDSPAAMNSPATPPRNPVAVTSWPRPRSTLATLFPLPPGMRYRRITRFAPPSANPCTTYVASTAGFSVIVRQRIIRRAPDSLPFRTACGGTPAPRRTSLRYPRSISPSSADRRAAPGSRVRGRP